MAENEELETQQEAEKKPNEEVAAEHPDYVKEILALVRKGLPPMALKDQILEYHVSDIAEALDSLTSEERARIFNLLDSQTVADIMDYAENVSYFREMSTRKQLAVLKETEADTAVAYLRAMPKDVRLMLIDLMDDGDKREIALISSFDEDEIGSHMTTNYIRIPMSISIREAMTELKRQAAEHDNISTLYVVDSNGGFYGAIDLKDLILARGHARLKDLITSSYPYVYGHEQISDCIERIKGYYEDSIPVLDDTNRLLGVITSADIVEISGDEMADDYAKFAGLAEADDLKEPLRKSMSKRLPWLIILLFLSMIVSSVLGLFETVIKGLPLIVSFQSLVLDMAGNVGTQSLSITIRVLMDDTLTAKQRLSLVLKELRVGTINGLLLGGGSLVVIALYLALTGCTFNMAIAVSACTALAMFISMILSSLTGTVVPLIFKKLNFDPAVASGPLITTINDLCAVCVYYGAAWILLLNVLHLGG